MTVLLWICSLPLIAEFAVAPFNLWSGRTMPNFERFTALSPRVATRVLAPVKLAGAGLLAVGLGVASAGVAGAAAIALVSTFDLSLALAVAVAALQVAR